MIRGIAYHAFLWRAPDGGEGYFDESGRNSRKSFLRSPMEFSRITSGFTQAREHPVLHTMRAHKGTDFAAPEGTPVRATADGVVMVAGEPQEGVTPKGDWQQVSVFLSVVDVHINRSPISGRVKRMAYVPGKFVNADLDKASEDNERQHLLVEGADGLRIGFTQIAGLVARRIVAFVKEGDLVEAGQRVGLIRFGSRVDVYLPSGVAPRVSPGQRAIAGETVFGIVGLDIPVTGSSQ